MIDLNNYKATRQWNIDRGYAFKLVPELENDMLEEEKKEFFDAYSQPLSTAFANIWFKRITSGVV